MPFLLRKIRKSKWYKHSGVPWLTEGELQADALDDLGTSNNELSVWLVDDNRGNLERVLTALAAKSDSFSHIDYAIFEQKILSDLNIEFKKSSGDTPDEEANITWHVDLVELTSSKRMGLAEAIMAQAERNRIQKKAVTQLIIKAVSSNQINLDRIYKEEFREKIYGLIS